MDKCDICGRTSNECKIRTINGVSYCPKHITQYYRYGSQTHIPSIYDKNQYIVHDDYAEIVLKNKYQDIVGYAIIDTEDVEECKKYKWHLRESLNTSYAIASLQENKKLHLHRLILKYDGSMDVDHINHNGLDNRKKNLRIVSHANNARTSHYQEKV